MKAEFFIARRYLFSKRKINLITIISAISIIGVTIGVAAMIIVLSVFNGFNSKVTSILIGFDPHIRIEPLKSGKLENYRNLLSSIDNSKIKYAAPFTLNKGMVATNDFNKVLFIKGVERDLIDKVSGLKETIRFGEFDLNDRAEFGGLVVGISVAYRLKIAVGDTVTIISPAGLESALTQFIEPVTRQFIVSGIFLSENKEYDSKYAYISFDNASALFKMGEAASGIEMRLDNIDNSESVKQYLVNKFGDKFNILTWYDLHKDFYSILKVERWVAFIILSLIIAVASFNILASLTMTVIEKKRDIGILKSMGASEKMITKIFMFEGIVVGLIGMFAGSFLGLVLTLIQKYFEIYTLDTSVYMINALPVELRFSDFIFVPLAAFVLCFLASLYPALRASNLNPVESIRWE
ncbi:MAG: ABC transporter permease [Ignavibacteria bacterium]|nr:ABC transporter permease [Ignavibacteria bacterium]